MAMDDRAVLVGGPFNDQCVGCENIADVVVIKMTDDDGTVHLYSLNVDLASASIYDYVGIEAS